MRWMGFVYVVSFVAACTPERGRSTSEEPDFVDLLAETNGKVEQFQYSPDGDRIDY